MLRRGTSKLHLRERGHPRGRERGDCGEETDRERENHEGHNLVPLVTRKWKCLIVDADKL